MSEFSMLIARLEAYAVTIDRLTREQEAEREAHRQGLESARKKNADLQAEISALRDGYVATATRTLHDIASLIERDNLSDAEKLQSIGGLLDQVMPGRKRRPPIWMDAGIDPMVAAMQARVAAENESTETSDTTDGDAPAAGLAATPPLRPVRRNNKGLH